jgi:transposase
VLELLGENHRLRAVIDPLLSIHAPICEQQRKLDDEVRRLAKADETTRRLMTVPGIGPITALCYLATIDDPTRFKRSRSVGAYAGLTARRYASGETDWSGRISKCGDKICYEATSTKEPMCCSAVVAKWPTLKACGIRLAKKRGLRRAKIAVARKLAVILHPMRVDGTEFNWSSKEATNQPA